MTGGWAIAAQQAPDRAVTMPRARMGARLGYVSASRCRGAGHRNSHRVLSGARAKHERSTDSVVLSESTNRGVRTPTTRIGIFSPSGGAHGLSSLKSGALDALMAEPASPDMVLLFCVHATASERAR